MRKSLMCKSSYHNTMKPILTALLLAPLAVLHAADPPATFCNPLPIPNFPIGFVC